MLHEDYDCNSSVEKKTLIVDHRGAWRQEELIGATRQSESNLDLTLT
jgi:hypothetical protein